MPKVTVLMAVHNGEQFIAEAVNSVLAQTLSDLELLVVDDASTDATASIVQKNGDRRVTYIANDRNRGLAASLNIGLRQAKGSLIARLDHDDVSRPDRLARQVDVLDREPSTAVVGSRARLIDARGTPGGMVERPLSKPGIRWMSLLENPLIHSSTMFRAGVARDLGGYREDVPFAEDFDLWARMLARHDLRNIAEPLIDYRKTRASIMSAVDRDQGAVDQLRRSHAGIIRNRIENEFGMPCESGDATLLAGVAAGLAPAEVDRFMTLHDGLSDRFESRHPDAATTPDYWRARARQADAVAHRLYPPSRRAATRLYWHALRRNPGLAAYVSWPRVAATVVLGRWARDRTRAMFKAAR